MGQLRNPEKQTRDMVKKKQADLNRTDAQIPDRGEAAGISSKSKSRSPG